MPAERSASETHKPYRSIPGLNEISAKSQPPQQQSTTNSNNKSGGSAAWPPSLRTWVSKIFHRIPQQNNSAIKSQVSAILKSTIQQVKDGGGLWTFNWDAYVCPEIEVLLLVKPQSTSATASIGSDGLLLGRGKQKKSVVQVIREPQAIKSTTNYVDQRKVVVEEPTYAQQKSSKRPLGEDFISLSAKTNFDNEVQVQQQRGGGESNRKKTKTASTFSSTDQNDQWDAMAKSAADQQPQSKQASRKKQSMGTQQSSQQELDARLSRFSSQNSLFKSSSSIIGGEQADFDFASSGLHFSDQRTAIVGVCQTLEKQFLRLTSAPDPSTVRPRHVLQQALTMVWQRWQDGVGRGAVADAYTFVCDQLKSIRQDLTVQMIRDQFTVEVYEMHAKIALQVADLGEYNQCQSQLMQLYQLLATQGIYCENQVEFAAYRLLYHLHTKNNAGVAQYLRDLTPSQVQKAAIRQALDVRRAISTGNYCQLFKLYQKAPNNGSRLLLHSFCNERERVLALCTITKAYKPTVRLSWLRDQLSFESTLALTQFLREHGVEVSDDPSLSEEQSLDCKSAHPQLLLASQTYNRVDIKGQI